ncbi:efflux RND transporter periplasmic adaptor subunit [Sulfitobacter geojensis]|uniref:efflux RND transporter periplasmic adaptor subunit n=1 Tax=Sulfitobacter geojensis TaxID=1342299 RepID=UPI0024929EFC|nr:HlyD family secretion protein [Sulfitobacter geojensis]
MLISYKRRVCGVAGIALITLLPTANAQSLDQQASGIVSARNHVVLSSQRSGQLLEQNAIAGSGVQEGEVLGRFDCSLDQAVVAVAQVEVQQANTDLELQRRLAARGAAGRAAVQAATQNVALQQARLALETAKTETCDLTAPFSGTVVDWKVRNFASVQQGEAIVELVDSADLFVELIIPVQWIDTIKVGQNTVFLSDYTARSYSATVDYISPAADPVSQTIRLNATLMAGENPPKVGTSGLMDFGN